MKKKDITLLIIIIIFIILTITSVSISIMIDNIYLEAISFISAFITFVICAIGLSIRGN